MPLLFYEVDFTQPSLKNASVARKARLCHDPVMDLEVARKALSKRSTFSLKRAVFFVVAGLCLVVGLLLRSGQYFSQPEVEQSGPVTVAAPAPAAVATTPAVETTESVAKTPPPAQEPPNEPAERDVVNHAEQTDEAVTKQPESPDSGMMLVSRQPIAMLASPSSSAPTTYGFPAGRPFRLIGRDGGFAQIQDLKSGARGWIDEAALAPPPRVPAVSTPFRPKPVAVSGKSNPSANPKPKATKKDSQVTAESDAATELHPVQTRERPGLFGQGGLFGGIFGSGN